MTDVVTPSPFFLATEPYERHRLYAELSASGSVHRVVLPHGETVWFVTDYELSRAVLTDPRLMKVEPPFADQLAPGLRAAINSNMLYADPPAHTRLRKLVSAAFTRRRVEGLAPRVQSLTDELLDPLARRAETGFDLLAEFTYPLTMGVICELLGVPLSGREHFRDWTEAVTNLTVLGPDSYEKANAELVDYMRGLISAKRAQPADDLVSGLVAARDGGDQLTEDEMTSTMHVLLIAGHETTANLIGNSVRGFLTRPGMWPMLRADPTQVPAAIEEVLRYDPPLQTIPRRRASQDLELGGVTIPVGGMVVVGMMAANHNIDETPNPHDLDLSNPQSAHLAFGHGIHFCVGAPLSRLEGRIALTSLLERFPDLRLSVPAAEVRTAPGLLMNVMETLPVTTRPA
jgi:cytochrome P450